MKHAYSFLAGAASVSLCVFATNSLPGYMFGLGILFSLTGILVLHFKGIVRLVPHWNSGTKGLSGTDRKRYTNRAGWRSKVSRQAHNLEIAGSNPAPAKVFAPETITQRRIRHSQEVSGGSVVSRFTPEQTKPVRVPNELRPDRYSSAMRNGKSHTSSKDGVKYPDVLSTLQQDVLSALINLKVPFAEAEKAVHEAARGGESFDELFRIALNCVNAGVGKSRRAAA